MRMYYLPPDWGSLIAGGLFLAVIVVVAVLVVALISRSRGAAGPVMQPAERKQLIDDSESRFREERGRVLDMVSAGQITAEEADRLIESMHRRTATMACPFCAEEIQVQAVKCRYCHSILVDSGAGKRLTKSHDRMLAGVCGGVADYLGVDAVMIRVGTVLVALLATGVPVILLYILGAIIMPDPD